jgi:3-methyladenine DNA glycosylase Mpg
MNRLKQQFYEIKILGLAETLLGKIFVRMLTGNI